MNEAPPLVSSLRPDLAELDPIFARALAKSPEHRQESCVALMLEIDEVLREVIAPRSSLVRARRNSRSPGADAIRLFLLRPTRRSHVRSCGRRTGRSRCPRSSSSPLHRTS